MDDMRAAMDSAADSLVETLVRPAPEATATRYATVVKNNGTTLDVRLAGGVLSGICMTTSCGTAKPGDRVMLSVAGPLVTATGIICTTPEAPAQWSQVIRDGVVVRGLGPMHVITVDCTVRLNGSWSYVTLGTISAGHRPQERVFSKGGMHNTSLGNLYLEVDPDGKVYACVFGANDPATEQLFRSSCCWISK